jgi:hypothetical protein
MLLSCSFVVAYTTASPGDVASSTAVSPWMGDRLGNIAAAEPIDGVSVWHLIADGSSYELRVLAHFTFPKMY